ncbi:MAG: 1-acyl-sn-glycerol-3-phosphate acyltransferase [Betaproteobacteria bacterium HGW-Betaproteobacteria-11]|nr:MAG: 1-acyl-sn-glycerol-3-phosphate acyltransferase [Betaproteobacteria bacterium HGW-Betaproteobacteria-11]
MTLSFTSLRAALRLAHLAFHLLRGLLSVALIYPLSNRSHRLAMKQRWSRQLVERLGVAIKVGAGETPEIPGSANGGIPHGFLVANHISFLDIFVINALAPAAFVAKQEVRHWPLLGWLARHTETIFLERGSRRAAQATREHLVGQLSAGRLVAVFPEGTTSDGSHVLPFHAALFQSAIDGGAPVLPWLLHYGDESGQTSHAADYVGETSLLECLWSIASAEKLIVHVKALPVIAVSGVDRRHLAAHAHHAIAHALGQKPGRHGQQINPDGQKPR